MIDDHALKRTEAITSLVTTVGTIFCAVGVWLACMAGRHFARRRLFLRNSAVAPGVVVGIREERDPTDVNLLYRPRIRFRTVSGQEVTFESSVASGDTEWRVGAPVRVRYDTTNPVAAECDSAVALWGATGLFAAMALVFLGLGTALLLGVIQP